jgi:hypothetical protein
MLDLFQGRFAAPTKWFRHTAPCRSAARANYQSLGAGNDGELPRIVGGERLPAAFARYGTLTGGIGPVGSNAK